MKKLVLILFSLVLLNEMTATSAVALTEYGEGVMRVAGEGLLPLRLTEVDAEISGFVTRVRVTQVFENPHDRPIEAIYTFPLPENAAVNGMQIIIGERVIRGVIQKKEEARQIYEQAKAEGKTAALLDQERPNIFNQSVANIMPGSEIRVEITYDEALKYKDGAYTFTFPMVVGPRYIPGVATGLGRNSDQVPDADKISPPVLRPGERNGHDIQLTVRLDAGTPVTRVVCPTHDIDLNTALPEDRIFREPVRLRLAQHERIPNKDFVLRYEVAGEKPETGLLTHVDPDRGGFFLLMFQPPKVARQEEVTPKELIFVMDCSGSMHGEPMSLSKRAMRHALKNLNPEDRFQIIRFSEQASPFASAPLENTPDNVRRGLSYINGLSGSGGTAMIEGVKAALDFPAGENRLRIVSFMTDGFIGNETDILGAIQRKMDPNTRLFSFGVGSSVNRYLLERMASVGRGHVQYMLLDESPEKQVSDFYERVRNPVLTHLEIDWGELEVEQVTPEYVPDLFQGQPVTVIGRYAKPGVGTIRIKAKVNGELVDYPIQVELPEDQDENASLASLWARSKITELELAELKRRDADTAESITQLALDYQLMSQYTSFVAVEEKVVNPEGDLVQAPVPVETPEGVNYHSAVGARPAASAPEPGTTGLILLGLLLTRFAVRRNKLA